MYTGLSDWNGNLVGHLKLTLSVLYTVVVDSQSSLDEDPARGRVRHLKGFRVEVNGRVYARLAANKTSITLKKCKSGMKYTCVVVAITCPEKQHANQRKVQALHLFSLGTPQ